MVSTVVSYAGLGRNRVVPRNRRPSVHFRHQQTVATRGGKLLEPCHPSFNRVGLKIEGDRGIYDVVVVDHGEAREIFRIRRDG